MTGSANQPTGGLHSVEAAVAGLEASLETGGLLAGVAAADELVEVTSELLEHVRDHPGHEPHAHAELVAALHVFRNAAYAFRTLAGAVREPDEGLASACAAMIEQGHDHLRRFYGCGPSLGTDAQ
jgi:hypothetical protein